MMLPKRCVEMNCNGSMRKAISMDAGHTGGGSWNGCGE